MNDRALITRVIVDDDHHAFGTLVRKYERNIRQFLRRLTSGDHALADDLSQEVFLTAYDKLSSFRADASFSTWLHAIAYRAFLTVQRKPYTSREVLSDALTEKESDNMQQVERELILEKMLALLSVPERTCVILAYSAGMSHPEICEVINMPLGTVKSHIKRGKAKLAELVG